MVEANSGSVHLDAVLVDDITQEVNGVSMEFAFL